MARITAIVLAYQRRRRPQSLWPRQGRMAAAKTNDTAQMAMTRPRRCLTDMGIHQFVVLGPRVAPATALGRHQISLPKGRWECCCFARNGGSCRSGLQPACNLEIGDLADKLDNAVDVLRSLGAAATFDILVARKQTTGTGGARLARVKASAANACSKLTQIKRALSRT